MVNHKFDLEKASQENLYGIERWVNEGSGGIIEKIHSQYVSISTFTYLIESSFIKLST